MALEELLTTSSGAINAGHHAEQGSTFTGLRYFRTYRGPNSVRARVKAGVPDCPELTGRGRLEENNLLFGNRIMPIGASRRVLSGKHRGPAIPRGHPPPWQQAVKGLIWYNLAMCADEGITVWALQAIVRRINLQR